MTHSGIVQNYREGIGAFDWLEGAKRLKICVTCTILFVIYAPMLHHIAQLLLYYFKLISLLKQFPRCNEDPVCGNPCRFRIAKIKGTWFRVQVLGPDLSLRADLSLRK